MNTDSVMKALRGDASENNREGMARFGIRTDKALGASMPAIRALAKKAGRSHELALELWASGVHEARILAALVDEPSEVTSAQMDGWCGDFDSWDVCDQVCSNLFDRTPYAVDKAME